MVSIKSIIYLIIIASIFASACSAPTKLSSKDYESTPKRIEILSAQITCYSPIEDAEFELFNVNGFGDSRFTIPGASSWNYKMVIKVKEENIEKWLVGFKKNLQSTQDSSWQQQIIPISRKQNWVIQSSPEHYQRNEQVQLILYRKENIIFKKIVAK